MDLLGWLNTLGEKADHYLSSDIKVAKALALRNPTLQKINELVDAYRGLLTIGFYVYMIASLYFLMVYDDGIMLKDSRFTAVIDRCARNASDTGAWITSDYTRTTCINATAFNVDVMLLKTGRCIDPAILTTCNCSGNVYGK